MFERIKEILEETIGQPRRESGPWYEYPCPYCCAEKGVTNDGKYNMAVNYGEDGSTKPYFHCWRCCTAGKLSKLLKDFGGSDSLSEYYRELKEIQASLMYKVDFGGEKQSIQIESLVSLPKDFRPLKKNDKYATEAWDYLAKRGLGDFFVNMYKIGYVPYWSSDVNMRNRIVIPSYDEYGDLNYYIARDFTGKRKYRKYNNPLIKKTMFVFNEDKVNWYEDVTLVEGAFDHMVIPNSIPLLGKTLKADYATYKSVVTKARANVNILLDDDATDDAKKIYKLLNSGKLKGRVRIIECPNGYDASDIYQKFGIRGIKRLMLLAKELDEYELVSIAV